MLSDSTVSDTVLLIIIEDSGSPWSNWFCTPKVRLLAINIPMVPDHFTEFPFLIDTIWTNRTVGAVRMITIQSALLIEFFLKTFMMPSSNT